MTTCVSPPELDEMQLAAFVAGEADRLTINHLTVCPYCHDKAARMARTHQSLARPLFRIHCPAPDDLREFHFGLLPDPQMQHIQHHLQSCARCTRELVQMDEFIADTVAPAPQGDLWGDLGQRIKTIVAQLSPRALSGTMLPALRGTPNELQSLYQAGELQIVIDIDRDAQEPEARTLLGAIMGGEIDEDEPWTAHLWQDQRLLASVAVDEFGSFRFTNVVPATYEIILAGLNLKIQIAAVTLD